MRGGQARGRVESAVRGDEDVAAEVDGDCFGRFVLVSGLSGGGGGGSSGRGGGAWGGLLAHEVAADDNVVLDDGLAGKDDVRRAVEEGAAGDFVAGVLRRERSVS